MKMMPRRWVDHPPNFSNNASSLQSSSGRSSVNSDKFYDMDHSAIPRRPGSGIHRVLPPIASGTAGYRGKEPHEMNTEKDGLQKREGKVVDKRESVNRRLKETNGKKDKVAQTSGKIQLPLEPGLSEKHITLAVKLPTGERLQRRFRPTDHLRVVLQFAEASSSQSLRGCEFVSHYPKTTFQNLKKTIQQCSLPDKTVLYIQLPEPV